MQHSIRVHASYALQAIIERSTPLDAPDQYWSTRAVFVHGIKLPAHFALAKANWNLSRPMARLSFKCHPCDQLPPGTNRHYGKWALARVPCAGEERTPLQTGRFCTVKPPEHFTCCNWPWVIPEYIRKEARTRRDAARATKRGRRGGRP